MSFSMWVKRLLYPGINLGVRSRHRKIVRHFLTRSDETTLDVGSGNGFFASKACKRGTKVLSVSFDGPQIERCKAFQPHMGCPEGRLEFRVMNAAEMDRLTETFDQILLLEVIEHLDNDLDVVSKLAKRLKPGGIMHLSTPDCHLGPWVGVLDRHAVGGHCRFGYSERRIYDLVRAAGLDVSFQTRLGGLGMYLTAPQVWLAEILGNSHAALTFTFLLVYPFYLLTEWIPVPYSWRMFHYVIARRPAHTNEPA